MPIITFSDVSFSGTSEPAIVYQVFFHLNDYLHQPIVDLFLSGCPMVPSRKD